MMEHQLARDAAIAFEVKKDGLQQRQSGDWVLRMTVAAIDMHQVIVNAAMGTRFQCVLVEIDDTEQPVEREATEHHAEREREKWRTLGEARQSGIRCKDPVFQAFLREARFFDVTDEESAADAVREICHVTSRSEFSKVGASAARVFWHQLDDAFQAWKAVEHA